MTSTPSSSISYSNQPTINDAELSLPVTSFSLEEYLASYQQIIAKFGYAPKREPGRTQILGWDLEYIYGPALQNFIDQLLIRRLNDFIPDNDKPFILDCGANIGFSVLNYKRQFPKARIIAFEPDPQFAPILRRNLERNKAADVEVVEAAVWIKQGETQWLCEGIDGSRMVAPDQPDPDTTVVRTIDLRHYLSEEVDLLKLDIEGAEYEVIIHLGDKLQLIKNMVIECHLDQTNVALLGQMLETLGTVGFQIGINSLSPWRDLIRQTKIQPNHWGQYLVVTAWHTPLLTETHEDSLPYNGIQQLENRAYLQNIQTQLQATQTQLQAAQTELDHYRSSRLIQLVRRLAGV